MWKVLQNARTSGETQTVGGKFSSSESVMSNTSPRSSKPHSETDNAKSEMPNTGLSNVSLQSAAQALGKIPLPTLDSLEEAETSAVKNTTADPTTDLLVDLSDGTESKSQVCTVVDQTSACSIVPADSHCIELKGLVSAVGSGGVNVMQGQTPSVAALFQQVQKSSSALPPLPWEFAPHQVQELPAAVVRESI